MNVLGDERLGDECRTIHYFNSMQLHLIFRQSTYYIGLILLAPTGAPLAMMRYKSWSSKPLFDIFTLPTIQVHRHNSPYQITRTQSMQLMAIYRMHACIKKLRNPLQMYTGIHAPTQLHSAHCTCHYT